MTNEMDLNNQGIAGETDNSPVNVSSILQRFEKQPFRASKHPPPAKPIPPTKPSPSVNGISQALINHNKANNKQENTVAPPTDCHVNEEKEPEVKLDRTHRSSPAGRRRSIEDGMRTDSPFRYAAPDILIQQLGKFKDEGAVKKKPLPTPPVPPPKPKLVPARGVEDKAERKETKTTAIKPGWIKINDHWLPSSENSERSSTTSVSSTETEDSGMGISHPDSNSAKENEHGANESSSKSSTCNDKELGDGQASISASLSSASFKKPAVPERFPRSSTEGRLPLVPSPGLSPHLRPLPPIPPSRPNRKNNPNTNSDLSTNSMVSVSDDSETESTFGANSSVVTDTDNQDGGQGESHDNVPPAVPTLTLTKEQKAYRCAEEFLVTEKSYVKTLEDLSVNFLEFMDQQAKAANRAIVEPDIPRIIAQKLHELRELHRVLAADFQVRLDNWDRDPRLADILLEKGPFLKMAIRFLQGKEDLAKEVINASKKHPEFLTALTTFEKQHFEGLHLVHMLDSVHQRLCRYPLLLTTYLKYLEPGSKEHETATKAKEFINQITLDLSSSLTQEDGSRRLSELYGRIVQSSFEVIQPGRKLLKEGPILKYSRKETQHRHLILFTDVLVCCAPAVANMLRVRYVFPLRDRATSISVKGDNRDPNYPGWEFVVKGRQKSIIFVAENEMEGKAWVNAIQNTIVTSQRRSSEYVPPRTSVILGDSPSVDETAPDPEPEQSPENHSHAPKSLGRLAPVWTPDQRVTMCQCCNMSFTTFRRRHHCRACGRVICDDDSGKAPLEYLDFKAGRVCPVCYAILYEQTKDASYMEDIMNRIRVGSSQFLCLFAAPKSGFRADGVGEGRPDSYDEESDSVLVKGYLRFSRNRQQWKQYWTVVRDDGVMEFYKALNDRMGELKIVLLGWQVRAVDRDEFMFELSHTNQFGTVSGPQLTAGSNGDANMHYWLKAENADSMDRWLSALNEFFAKFAC